MNRRLGLTNNANCKTWKQSNNCCLIFHNFCLIFVNRTSDVCMSVLKSGKTLNVAKCQAMFTRNICEKKKYFRNYAFSIYFNFISVFVAYMCQLTLHFVLFSERMWNIFLNRKNFMKYPSSISFIILTALLPAKTRNRWKWDSPLLSRHWKWINCRSVAAKEIFCV